MGVVLLLISAGLLWVFVRQDAAEYAAFKRLTRTEDRQRCYRAWVLKSFVAFCVVALLGLVLMHRLDAVLRMPQEFVLLSHAARAKLPVQEVSTSFLGGPGAALLVGLLGGTVLLPMLGRRSKPLMVGDVEALLPRNGAETGHTAVLAVNAGVCEELYFRLYLPLLLVSIHVPPLYAFVLAGIVFGLIHAYQGVVGVVATTVLGGVMSLVYLASGSLLVVMGVHAALDLLSLVVRPSLQRLVART